MIIAAVLAALVLTSCGGTVLARRSRRTTVSYEISQPIDIRGTKVSLPEAVWAFSAIGGARKIVDTISTSKATTAEALRDEIDAMIVNLPAADSKRLAARANDLKAAAQQRTAWTSHSDYVATASALGGIDAVILAGGDLGPMTFDLVDPTQAADVVGQGLAFGFEHLRGVKPSMQGLEAFAPDLASSMSEHLATLLEPVADSLVEVGGNAAELLFNIADSHVPIATTILSINKAIKSSSAGLDGSRVGENFAWDVGVRGGSIATGAIIGSAIVPVVGTIIGGILGGLFGGEVAAEGKMRHYRAARAAADAAVENLGASIRTDRWAAQTAPMEKVVDAENEQLDILLAAADGAGSWWPDPRVELLRAAAEVGEADHQERRRELAEWKYAVARVAGPGHEPHRATMVMTRPSLQRDLGIDSRLITWVESAYSTLQDEQKKLELSS